MSNALAPRVRARPNPIFGRPVHQGSPPIDYSPILLLKPFGFRIAPDTLSSDENLAGQRGITPAFGSRAPHPSGGGTLNLLIHARPSLGPDRRPLRFRRVPFGRDVTFNPGGATASRIAMPHMLPSTVPSVSASAKLLISWLNPPPHPITVYASHPPSPTTAQHSLPGGALPPYRGRSFTGRTASASPDAPEPRVRIHSANFRSRARCLAAATPI